MKKNLVLRAALMAALPLGLAMSCTKEVSQKEEIQPVVKAGPCVIIADIPESKVSLTPGDGGVGLGLAWENTDQLRVISDNGGATFDIKNIDGKKATFEGTAVEGTSYTVLYPGTYETVETLDGRSYTSQVQIGNANTDHLEWNAKVTGLTDYSSVTFSGENCLQNGALKFHFKMPADFTKVYSVSLSAPTAIFSVDNGNSAQVSELTLSLKDDASTDGLTLGADKIFTAYMMVSWNEASIAEGTELTIKVKGDQEQPWTKVKTVGEGGFTISGGKVTSLKLNDQNWDEPLFWAGSGTETDPYQIKTVKHLQNVSIASAETAGLYFTLLNDLDLENMEWTPINNTGTVRDLNFDGGNHKISNLKVSHNSTNAYYNSLFGYLTGSVKDLTIENADVYSGNSVSATGVLSGWFQKGSITNVDVTGTNHIHIVNNNSRDSGCGGLVGAINNVTVKDCDVSGVTFTFDQEDVVPQNVGGLTGATKFNACTIENCTVNGSSVLAAYRAGGLVGSADIATTITDCNVGTVSSVTVEAEEAVVDGGTGGLVGAGTKAVTFRGCHFNGSVTGVALVGGLTGQIAAKTTYDDCSSAGSVKATGSITDFVSGETASYAGGIAGAAKYSDELTSCSSTANVTAAVGGIVGGLIGDGAGVTLGQSGDASKACYYRNGTVSGYGGSTYAPASVAGMIAVARDKAVKIYGGGVENATITSKSYCVGGVVGLNNVATSIIDGTVVSESKISGTRIIGGIMAFPNYAATITSCKVLSGSVHGSGVSGGNGETGGIVGYNGTGALTVTGCESSAEVTSDMQYAGGIVGRQQSNNANVKITSCKSSGSVTAKYNGNSYAGGIVGLSLNGTISKCYSTATVAGNKRVGGILGFANCGIIEECAFEGTLKSGQFAGGVLGCAYGSSNYYTVTVRNCFSTGSVSSLSPLNTGNESGGAGGIVGSCEVAATNLSVENCYSTAKVTGGVSSYAGVGGIFGVHNAGTMSVSKCLAWNEELDFSNVGGSNGRNGAISELNSGITLSDNYRTTALVIGTTYKLNGTRALEDNAAGRDGAVYSGTCSAKAAELGWDENVWDLTSGDYPVLINVAK